MKPEDPFLDQDGHETVNLFPQAGRGAALVLRAHVSYEFTHSVLAISSHEHRFVPSLHGDDARRIGVDDR